VYLVTRLSNAARATALLANAARRTNIGLIAVKIMGFVSQTPIVATGINAQVEFVVGVEDRGCGCAGVC
jgi:hypothetical protein